MRTFFILAALWCCASICSAATVTLVKRQDATHDVPASASEVAAVVGSANALTMGSNGSGAGSIVLQGLTSGSCTLAVASAAGTSTRFQLPTTNGTAGYVLRTDGAGNTSWVAAGAGVGTVTSVATSGGLTGGPITGTGTISIAAGGIENSMVNASAAIAGTKINPDFGAQSIAGGSLDVLGGTVACDGLSAVFGASFGLSPTATGYVTFNGITSGAVTQKCADVAGAWTWTMPTSGGTNHYVLETNGSGVSQWVALSAANITAGTLGVARGGTGLASGTSGGLLYFSGSTTIASSGALTSGALMVGGGAGSAPTASTVPATGVLTFLGTPTSANLAAAVTNETGSGALVFATSPTLVTPVLGVPSSGTLTSCTGLPVSTGISGLGTGVATALAVNTGTAGAFQVNNASGASLTALNATQLTSGTIPSARFPAGTMITFAKATLAPGGGDTSTTSSTYVTSGLAVTLTVKSATSFVRILVSGGIPQSSGAFMYVTIKRGTTDVAPGVYGLEGFGNNAGNGYRGAHSIIYTDSPGATGATTYTVYFRNDDNVTTVYYNRDAAGGNPCVITAEEIAQ